MSLSLKIGGSLVPRPPQVGTTGAQKWIFRLLPRVLRPPAQPATRYTVIINRVTIDYQWCLVIIARVILIIGDIFIMIMIQYDLRHNGCNCCRHDGCLRCPHFGHTGDPSACLRCLAVFYLYFGHTGASDHFFCICILIVLCEKICLFCCRMRSSAYLPSSQCSVLLVSKIYNELLNSTGWHRYPLHIKVKEFAEIS